jgi:hypothetical protein
MREAILPSEALALLREQHEQIRQLADRCDAALAACADHEPIADEAGLAVARLRIAVNAHNRDEEALLGPILVATDAFGPVRVGEMMRGHAAEHQLLREALYAPTVAAIRPVIAQLRAHLEDEEAFFLTHRIVRDDLVSVEADG